MTAGHLPMGEGREFDAIRAMLQVWGARARGIGDDAAVLDVPAGQHLVVSTDASVEGVHFRREWLTPEEVGGRATVAALSDIAAMGALPIGMLLALAVPPDWMGKIVALSRGVGDALYVTGRLGGPRAAVRAWMESSTPRVEHRARFATPRPRIAEGRWLADAGCHAGIDISDGLIADAGHLALASGVGFDLDLNGLPCVKGVSLEEAASGGEEYELLVAAPVGGAVDPISFEQRFGVPLTLIGRAREGSGIAIRGATRVDLPRGHDHFS